MARAGPAVVAVEVNLSVRISTEAVTSLRLALRQREGHRGGGRVRAAAVGQADRGYDRLVEVAEALAEAGAEALTLITPFRPRDRSRTRRAVLGAGGGALSGPRFIPWP